jgi:hypothetical protein
LGIAAALKQRRLASDRVKGCNQRRVLQNFSSRVVRIGAASATNEMRTGMGNEWQA